MGEGRSAAPGRRGARSSGGAAGKLLCAAARAGDEAAVLAIAGPGGSAPKLAKSAREQGMSPLMWAARAGRLGCVRILLAAGAADEAKADTGETALALAAGAGHAECVEEMMGSCDASIADCNGRTPLMDACMASQWRCVLALLRAGGEERRDFMGDTALHFAAHRGCERCVGLLIPRSDLAAEDDCGRTPARMAELAGAQGVAELIEAARAARAEAAEIAAAAPEAGRPSAKKRI